MFRYGTGFTYLFSALDFFIDRIFPLLINSNELNGMFRY